MSIFYLPKPFQCKSILRGNMNKTTKEGRKKDVVRKVLFPYTGILKKAYACVLGHFSCVWLCATLKKVYSWILWNCSFWHVSLAVITQYHRLGSFNNRDFSFLTIQEARSLRFCQGCFFLKPPSFVSFFSMCLHMFFLKTSVFLNSLLKRRAVIFD